MIRTLTILLALAGLTALTAAEKSLQVKDLPLVVLDLLPGELVREQEGQLIFRAEVPDDRLNVTHDLGEHADLLFENAKHRPYRGGNRRVGQLAMDVGG